MKLRETLRCCRNAWRRLGNMNQDTAMERYIELLSGSIPWWLQDDGDVCLMICFSASQTSPCHGEPRFVINVTCTCLFYRETINGIIQQCLLYLLISQLRQIGGTLLKHLNQHKNWDFHKIFVLFLKLVDMSPTVA